MVCQPYKPKTGDFNEGVFLTYIKKYSDKSKEPTVEESRPPGKAGKLKSGDWEIKFDNNKFSLHKSGEEIKHELPSSYNFQNFRALEAGTGIAWKWFGKAPGTVERFLVVWRRVKAGTGYNVFIYVFDKDTAQGSETTAYRAEKDTSRLRYLYAPDESSFVIFVGEGNNRIEYNQCISLAAVARKKTNPSIDYRLGTLGSVNNVTGPPSARFYIKDNRYKIEIRVPSNSQASQLSGELPVGKLKVSPQRQVFSKTLIGSVSKEKFSLKNDGNDCLRIEEISDAFPFSATKFSIKKKGETKEIQSLPTDLDPREELIVEVSFSPSKTEKYESQLPIKSTAGGSNKMLMCQGRGEEDSSSGDSGQNKPPRSFSVPIHRLQWDVSGGWKYSNLTIESGGNAPNAVGHLTGHIVTEQDSQHIFYRGEDAHIHQLWSNSLNQWKYSDLTLETNSSNASGSPLSYYFPNQRSQHVFYRGTDNHVHQLFWTKGEGWRRNDITQKSGDAPLADSDLTGYVFSYQQSQHVFYRGTDNHVHQLFWTKGEGWRHNDITQKSGEAPPGIGDLASHVLIDGGERTQHVFYRAADNSHIHQLWWNKNDGWRFNDLSRKVNTLKYSRPAQNLTCHAFTDQKSQHIFYRALDGYIHQLWWNRKDDWRHNDLTQHTGRIRAQGISTSYVSTTQKSQHVFYTGSDKDIYHAWWSERDGWKSENVGKKTPGDIPSAGSLFSYEFVAQGSRNLVYISPVNQSSSNNYGGLGRIG